MIRHFLTDQRGLETVEYSILTALVVGAVVVALVALTLAIQAQYASVSQQLTAPP